MNDVIIKYFSETLPARCGYTGEHLAAIGRLIKLGYEYELKDDTFLPHSMPVKERSSFMLPYGPVPGFESQYSRGKSVAEAVFLANKVFEHKEGNIESVELACNGFNDEEIEVVKAAGSWNL